MNKLCMSRFAGIDDTQLGVCLALPRLFAGLE
jgi:hypothetical protein